MKTKHIDAALQYMHENVDATSSAENERIAKMLEKARQELQLIQYHFKFHEGMFNITSVSRADIEAHFNKKVADRFNDDDMTYLASKMADDYCTQLFHNHLPLLVELLFPEKTHQEDNEEEDD
jgi:hypothetical protein